MFRGYLALNDVELANSSRVVAHMARPVPAADTPVPACACPNLRVGYDDTWTGLQAALGDPDYMVSNAPWYSPAIPESAEFFGIWVMDVQGLDTLSVQREIIEAVCAGGAAGTDRDTTKAITVSALVVACTNAGATFGLEWLACQLRAARRATATLSFYGAHPGGSAAVPASLLRRITGCVVTKNPAITEIAGKGGASQHRQASVFRTEFSLAALNPYVYGPATTISVVWDTSTSDSIQWVHAPDCASPGDCDLPVLFNADCVPETIEVAAAPVPECGGCLPVCSVDRKTFQLDSVITRCDETAVTIRVINTGSTPVTVNMFWQPCGSTDICDRVNYLQISGLPVAAAAVADSVEGRPYAEIAGDRLRQVGIISTQTGAPWRPAVIDRALCWELVAESAPGALYDVELTLSDRMP